MSNAEDVTVDGAAVWLVVLTWNGRADTLELLARLAGVPATVLVVDNGSCDGTLDQVTSRFPAVRTLQTGANLGYAGGNNAGIRHALAAGAGVIAVLNNDTLVDRNFLAPLLAFVGAHPRSAVSPDIRYADEPQTSWFRGAEIDGREGWPVHLPLGRQPPTEAGPFPSPVLTGCCIVAKSSTWREVGLFDEGLFLMFEDSDWSLRARTRGIGLYVVPESTISHKVSRSFTGAADRLGSYYFARNGAIFAARHLGRCATARFVCRAVIRPALAGAARHGERRRGALMVLGLLAAGGGRRGVAGKFARHLAKAGGDPTGARMRR